MTRGFLALICFFFFLPFLNAQDKDRVIVSKDGTADYSTIQEAINNTKAFPYKKITIFIKNGIYREKVKLHEWNTNILLLGESRDKTIIIFEDYFAKINAGRNSTFLTPTLSVEANDTVLKNLTIENSAGEIGQAVALSVTGTRVAVINCKLIGNQDTLYASGEGKQYFKDSYIEGTTDFIFGNATAFFEKCEIVSKKDSYITAASTPEKAKYGFVFYECKFSALGNVSKVYLGRPWRSFAKTAVIKSTLGHHILPEGWHNWNNIEAEKTSVYSEYQNFGAGAGTKFRVNWSHQLSRKQAAKYNLRNVLEHPLNKNWFLNL